MRLTRTVSSETAFEDAECLSLYEHCMTQQSNSVVVEIGCQLGRTSSIITQVGKYRGYQSIHIDPYIDDPAYLLEWHRMMHAIGNPYIHFCMPSKMAYAELRLLGPIDLLLIDGDHTEDGVREDCSVAGEIVKSGGVMLAHDYGRDSLPDVWRVMNKYTAQGWESLGAAGTLGGWRRK